MNDIALVAGSVFGIISRVMTLYTTNFILSAVLALWIIKRVARLFNRL